MFKSFISLFSSRIFNNEHAIDGSAKCLFSDCFTLTDERTLVENGSSLSNKNNLSNTFKYDANVSMSISSLSFSLISFLKSYLIQLYFHFLLMTSAII